MVIEAVKVQEQDFRHLTLKQDSLPRTAVTAGLLQETSSPYAGKEMFWRDEMLQVVSTVSKRRDQCHQEASEADSGVVRLSEAI